jgi:CRP/FNR family cyclic AMP-dependent transcriptional regulator
MKEILLIDDDPDMRQNTSEILELEGYRVIKAENGERGVELARLEAPDLVLCDIAMPELDGYGVLRALGQEIRTAGLPFIFLSAKADRADVRKGMDLGADDYLTKPFTARELLDSVDGRLKRSELFRKGFGTGLDGLNHFIDQARGLEGLKDLGAHRRTRRVETKQVLFHEGDELHDVPYLVQGKMRTFKVNKDGKEFTTGLYSTGEFIGYMGLLEGGLATESVEALESSEVALIPQAELLALLHRDRDVSVCFIKMLAHDMKDKEAHLLQLAYASVRQRVAQSLLRLHDRYAKDSTSDLGVRITREDLASMVGTATESLIRCLAELRQEQLVDVRGRDIRITNKAGLEKLART